MAKAVKCPVCDGRGKVNLEQKKATVTEAAITREKTCHGCAGKGWVEVLED